MSDVTAEKVREAYRSAAAAMLACKREDVETLKALTETVDAESLASALMGIGLTILHHGFGDNAEEVLEGLVMDFATANDESWELIAENSESF